MSDEEHKKAIANDILLAVIKEFRLPLWGIVGFVAAQLVGFLTIGVADHYTLKQVEETQRIYIIPKMAELWDDHWKKNP